MPSGLRRPNRLSGARRPGGVAETGRLRQGVFARHDPKTDCAIHRPVIESNANTRLIPITFFSDGLRLQGILHLPPRTPAPVVIGAHGLLGSAESPKQIALARDCTQNGIAFFRFDHRGCGQSQGRFESVTTLEGRRSDLLAAADAVAARPEIVPTLGLFGSSLGGAVCIAAAKALAPRALVIAAAPVRSRSIHTAQGATDGEIPAPALSFDIARHLAGLSRILIVHGDADEVVPVDNALEIHRGVAEPKTLLILSGGDHRMSAPRHQKTFAETSIDWFGRHLGPASSS